MKKLLLITGVFLFSFVGLSQENSKYNLPPGAVLKRDAKIKSLAYKLNEIPLSVDPKWTSGDFLGHLSSELLEDMKSFNPERYDYYMEANTFYKALSPRVKSGFSIEEL
ncbi:MAG: hypothetical protein JKY09_01140, partial [Crocinitomicaceae bacterium]|nr:hypothetical protein [Crocinitomicaceae bacterium]